MKKLYVAVLGIVGVLGFASPAFAVDPTPAESATTLVTTGVTQLTPVILAVATAGLGLVIITFAVRKAYGLVRSGGRRI